MNKKHIFAGLIGFAVILGWNVFLIHRDNTLYEAYYKQQSIENSKQPYSNLIR